ncbi:hypothetical protein ACLMAJ_07650 [Nocardia sp. KC 131]|uniref:hypothetical protein n=1 Tax=Nocardia arseniciresistens TaxID=3392119 RepID=UPI00398F892B
MKPNNARDDGKRPRADGLRAAEPRAAKMQDDAVHVDQEMTSGSAGIVNLDAKKAPTADALFGAFS